MQIQEETMKFLLEVYTYIIFALMQIKNNMSLFISSVYTYIIFALMQKYNRAEHQVDVIDERFCVFIDEFGF